MLRLPWARRVAVTPAEEFARRCREETPHLLRLARRLTQGSDDPAQDLVQDTLIRAFEAFLRDDYTDRGNLRAYLMRILTNRFLSLKRTDAWRAETSLDALDTVPAETTEHPLLTQTLDEPLERALASLPDGLRAAIILVDVEGLEYSEAAKALGIPLGTVRSRLFRARHLLHQSLLPCAIVYGWIPSSSISEVVL